jgi:aminobenzoyl-glutamate transport protein
MSRHSRSRRFRWLDVIEAAGNRLPDPAILFVWATAAVVAFSALADVAGWSVQPVRPEAVVQSVTDPATGVTQSAPVLDGHGRPEVRLSEVGDPIRARSLLSSDGVFWLLRTMVKNFIEFAPLGVILVTMLGVGVAERSGLIGALLKALMRVLPVRLLTPAVVFLGVQSSLGADSGYVVLPPIAALLFKSVGRSPLAGIAAVFSGISAGFSSNLLITSLDPLLASLTQAGARVIDPGIEVNAASNWWFMIASTGLLTLLGWGVTAWIVEPRLGLRPAEDGGPPPATSVPSTPPPLDPQESRALRRSMVVFGAVLAAVAALVLIPGAPLHGDGQPESRSARWIIAIVPILLLLFLLPGLAYGRSIGSLRDGRDLARVMSESLASTAPVMVLAFFAGQFIACFKYSQLDQLVAYSLGKSLAASGFSPLLLLAGFVALVMGLNLLISSASAKWALFAPVFVPIFMLLQISPELTQAAYRVADSCTNVVTPLNPYLVLVLGACRLHAPTTGTGTVLSMMVPYALTFAVVWTLFLLGWSAIGWPLGPGGGLHYAP